MDTDFEYIHHVRPDNLVTMLRSQAESHADQTAIIYLRDGENDEVAITYRDLDQQARQIAAKLQQLSRVGERALLLYPPGLDYITAFFGCLYSGVIAVPAYPPRLNRPAPRIQAILADSGAKIALTTSEILESMQKRFVYEPDLETLNWIDTQSLPDAGSLIWEDPGISSETLAFLQYTSGSTSIPKGVMLSHANLVHNLEQITAGFEVNNRDVVVSWLPSYHDMGLIGAILGTIYNASKLILIAPIDFLQRPLRWLNAISKYKATVSGGPNFAYDFCVEKVKPEQLEALDLSTLRLAFSGAEPVRLETMQKFSDVFSSTGFRMESFYPCYGLAEATLFVTGRDISSKPVTLPVHRSALEENRIEIASIDSRDAQLMISCGSTRLGTQIKIVDPETLQPCAPDRIGEIWIQGQSVARGYWNRPEENASTFNARIHGESGVNYLRTGDLGFLYNDELYITGRLKDLIIIRGSNHYPQDIELTVEKCHAYLQTAGGAVFSIDVENEEKLVVVQEIDRQYRREDLSPAIQAIRYAIAENHDLQVHSIVLIKPFTIPKTSSGKIQRHACKAQYLGGQLEVITEWHAGR